MITTLIGGELLLVSRSYFKELSDGTLSSRNGGGYAYLVVAYLGPVVGAQQQYEGIR